MVRIVDNDVIIKLSRFDLLELLFGEEPAASVLATARFVVRSRLKAHSAAADRVEVIASRLQPLEPTEEQIRLVAAMLDAASTENLAVDGGEAMLFVIASQIASAVVITGDRRAIEGAEQLLPVLSPIRGIAGKVHCLEQLLLQALESGEPDLKKRICADPGADKTLAICFSCSSDLDDTAQQRECLESYIAATRRVAPTLLAS